MNTISRTGIEGFDYCFNPVRGCQNDCEGKYGFACWARADTALRAGLLTESECKFRYVNQLPPFDGSGDQEAFPGRLFSALSDFEPVFLESQFAKNFPKKPSRIIVGWESDIYYWEQKWMYRVITRTQGYKQHQFYFLTKNPAVYKEYFFPGWCWLGTTLTKGSGDELRFWTRTKNRPNRAFLSIEPLQQRLTFSSLEGIDWIIIGAQTGSGNKVIPKREWVEQTIRQARLLRIPVYLKDNLLKAVPGLPRLKEIPG